MPQKSVPVRINITLVIDVDAWSYDYGVTPGQVRADVQEYVKTLIQGTVPHQINQ